MIKRYPILLKVDNDQYKKYSAEFQTEERYYHAFRKILAKAHRKKVLFCCCPSKVNPEEKPLYVAYYSDTDTYVLKAYPRTKNLHAKDCVYRIGVSSYPAYFIPKIGHNSLTIRTEIGVKIKKQVKEEKKKTSQRINLYRTQTKTQNKKTPYINIAFKLWEKANLHKCESSHNADIDSVSKKLLIAAKNFSIRKNISLEKILLVPCYKNEDLKKHNLLVMNFCIRKKYRPLVICTLANYTKEDIKNLEEQNSIKLKFFSGIPRIVVKEENKKEIFSLLEKKDKIQEATKTRVNIILICHCEITNIKNAFSNTNQDQTQALLVKKIEDSLYEVSEGGAEISESFQEQNTRLVNSKIFLTALKVKGFIVSQNWIPIQNENELKLITYLNAKNLSFIKPLNSEDNIYTPEFFLIENPNSEKEQSFTPIKIIDANLEAHKKAIINYLKQTYKNFILWLAYKDKKVRLIRIRNTIFAKDKNDREIT